MKVKELLLNLDLKKLNFLVKLVHLKLRRITVEERESDDFRKKKLNGTMRDHALFVGYMPHDKAKILNICCN